MVDKRNIGYLKIHGTYETANNSTINNVVFFFVSGLKIVDIRQEREIFCGITYLKTKTIQNCLKIDTTN